jgi:hypothetical protein
VTCAEYEKQAQHLTSLALNEAWKAYIWHRLNELDQVPLFAGIKDEVLRRIESSKRQHKSGG